MRSVHVPLVLSDFVTLQFCTEFWEKKIQREMTELALFIR